MIQSGTGLETYHLMRKYGLFQELFPLVADHFTSNHSSDVEKMLDKTFYLMDSRFREGRRLNIAFVFAAILWYPMKNYTHKMRKKRVNYHSFIEASSVWLNQVVEVLSIPRRHTLAIREIWQLQLRFLRRYGKQAFRLLEVKKFQLGFSFLKVRGSLEGGETQELANWWATFRSADQAERQAMVSRINNLEHHKKKPPCKKIKK